MVLALRDFLCLFRAQIWTSVHMEFVGNLFLLFVEMSKEFLGNFKFNRVIFPILVALIYINKIWMEQTVRLETDLKVI